MLNTPNSAHWLKVLSGAASLMGASLFLSLPALAELEDSKTESLSSGAAEIETTDTEAVEPNAADAIKPEATNEMGEVTGYEVVEPAAATDAEIDADVTAEIGTEADAEMTGVEAIDAADAEVDAEVNTEVSIEADTETELDANLEQPATEEDTVELEAAEPAPAAELEAGVEAETDVEAELEAVEPSVPSVESDAAATEEPVTDTFDLNADDAGEQTEPEASVEAEDLNSSSDLSSGDAIAEDISETTMPEATPEALPNATSEMEPAPAAPAPMGTETESEVEPSADALTEPSEDPAGLETSVEPEELEQFASAIPVLQSLEQSAREEVDAAITESGLTPQRFTELYQAQAEGAAPVTEITPEEQASFETLVSQIESIESETLSEQNNAIRAEGLEPERFTEIMAMVQQNPTLQEQVIQMMQPASTEQ